MSAGNHQLWLFSAMISKMVRSVPAMPACLSPHRAAGRITLRAGNHLGHDRAHWTTAHSGQSSWTFSWTCSVPAPPRGTYVIKREAAASSLAPARVVCYNYSALIRNAPNRKTVEGEAFPLNLPTENGHIHDYGLGPGSACEFKKKCQLFEGGNSNEHHRNPKGSRGHWPLLASL